MASVDTAIIRQGELIGRELMAYETAEAVGSVEHLLVDIKRFSTGAAAPSPPNCRIGLQISRIARSPANDQLGASCENWARQHCDSH